MKSEMGISINQIAFEIITKVNCVQIVFRQSTTVSFLLILQTDEMLNVLSLQKGWCFINIVLRSKLHFGIVVV